MGRLDVHIRHGGGGPDGSVLVLLALAAIAVTGAAAVIVTAAAVLAAVLAVLLAVTAAVWFATRGKRAARRAEVTARWAANRQATQIEAEQRRLRRAIASAPQVTVTIDAGLLAGLAGAAQPPQQAKVIRGEVEQ